MPNFPGIITWLTGYKSTDQMSLWESNFGHLFTRGGCGRTVDFFRVWFLRLKD